MTTRLRRDIAHRPFGRWCLAFLAVAASAGLLSSPVRGDAPPPTETGKPTDLSKLPALAVKAFGPGEKLSYVIKYEFVVAGKASLEVGEAAPVDGRPTLSFTSRAESNDFTDVFFKVRDFNLAQVDRATMASLRFHQNLHEGNYKVIRNTSVDYGKGVYTYHQEKRGKTRESSGPVDGPVADILSSFFVTRTLALEAGKNYRIKVLSDEKVYFLRVDVGSKVETIKVPAGKFACIKVQPQIIGDAIFKAQEGRMTIWLTNDERRVPVLIRSKVAVGSFDAELESLELPKL
jgi:hypothetical protein